MSFYLIQGAVYIRRNRLDNLNRYPAFMIRIKKHPKDLTNFVRGGGTMVRIRLLKRRRKRS
ncbi:hypothetical protein D3Z50_13295 [Clostridiaceae bacterium]|nr:hypothetical protein [Clostridiaceae bacterium]